MSDELTERADGILREALETSGARDPREFYRDRLKELREANPEGYRAAVAYCRETLIPAVASREHDPLNAWTEYGRRLTEALAPGRTVSIDESGRSQAYSGGSPRGRLVLHLPEGKAYRALLVALPTELSPAQRATYDVLVSGKHRARG